MKHVIIAVFVFCVAFVVVVTLLAEFDPSHRNLKDTLLSYVSEDLQELERLKVQKEQEQERLEIAEIQDQQGSIPFYRKLKNYGTLAALTIILGAVLIIAVAYHKKLTVHVLKIGKHSEIPIKHSDLSKLAPEVSTGLVLAQELKARAPEKAFQLYERLSDVAIRQIQALKGFYGKPTSTIDVQPAALSQSNHIPTFQELLNTGQVAPGQPLIFGFRKNTGHPETGELDELYSTGIFGWPGFGKTTLIAYIMGASVLSRQAKFDVLDIQYPHPESLGAHLGSLIDTPFINLLTNPFEVEDLLSDLQQELRFRLNHPQQIFAPRILVVDEHERWSKNNKALVDTELDIVNEGRKVGMYLFLTSKSTKADKIGDSALRDTLITSYLFKTKIHNARTFYKDKSKEILVKQLENPGEAIFTNRYDDSFIVRIPNTSLSDMKYVVDMLPRGTNILTQDEIASQKRAEEFEFLGDRERNHENRETPANDSVQAFSYPEKTDCKANLTPEMVKSGMKLSLNKTADVAGIPRSTLSNYLNEKGNLSEDQVNSLRACLFPETSNVISFEQRRKTPVKQT
jgi:hypothetical protein